MNIKNKVVIIAGASSGIGAATVEKLAQEGARLVIGARREERLQELVEKLPEAEIFYQVVDVTKPEDMEKLTQLALDKFGRIDVLFNNAGIMPTAKLSEHRYDEWRKMLSINVMGVLNGISAVLPTMQKQKSGLIIATDSVAGHVVYEGSAVYCGSKFAVRAIMEGLRQEEHQNGIRSTLISPGAVRTELYQTIQDKKASEGLHQMQMQPGLGLEAQDVAEAVAYAISTPEHVAVSEVIIRPAQQSI